MVLTPVFLSFAGSLFSQKKRWGGFPVWKFLSTSTSSEGYINTSLHAQCVLLVLNISGRALLVQVRVKVLGECHKARSSVLVTLLYIDLVSVHIINLVTVTCFGLRPTKSEPHLNLSSPFICEARIFHGGFPLY